MTNLLEKSFFSLLYNHFLYLKLYFGGHVQSSFFMQHCSDYSDGNDTAPLNQLTYWGDIAEELITLYEHSKASLQKKTAKNNYLRCFFLFLIHFYQITYTCVRLVGFGFKAWFRMQVLNFHLTYYVVFKTMIKLCRLLKLNGHSLYSIPLLVMSIKFEFTVTCRLQMQTNNWRILFSSLLTSNY